MGEFLTWEMCALSILKSLSPACSASFSCLIVTGRRLSSLYVYLLHQQLGNWSNLGIQYLVGAWTCLTSSSHETSTGCPSLSTIRGGRESTTVAVICSSQQEKVNQSSKPNSPILCRQSSGICWLAGVQGEFEKVASAVKNARSALTCHYR